MMPTLRPDEFVLVDLGRRPTVGAVVLAADPRNGRDIVKRVVKIEGGKVWLGSDNPAEGTDSRQFGPVGAESVLGVVTLDLSRVTVEMRLTRFTTSPPPPAEWNAR
jgi:hypothetical protein